MKFVCAFYHKSTTNKCWKCFPLKSYLPIWTGKCFKNLPLKKSLYPWQVCTRARSDARDRSLPLKKSSPDLNSYLKSYFPQERWLGKNSFANILALADNLRIRCSNIPSMLNILPWWSAVGRLFGQKSNTFNAAKLLPESNVQNNH